LGKGDWLEETTSMQWRVSPGSQSTSLVGASSDEEGRPDPKPPARPQAAAELLSVSKVFEATVAVNNVSLALYPGEVLGLVGENGAGKSTCVKMLGGVYRPDSGQVRVAGQDVSLRSPLDAHGLGVAVVHQYPSLFADLSIAENVFAGQ